MKEVKVGIIKEGKVPVDKRVPLTPEQCKKVEELYPHVKFVIQPSDIRCYSDAAYAAEGLELNSDLSDCDIIMGVKEVNPEDLIPHKKFIFFSHTYKKQPYNRKLLQTILDKKIQLIDYELMRDQETNLRLLGFGRYAGIVGCYNGFRTFGLKTGRYNLIPAWQCHDREEMERELKKVDLPRDMRVIFTGFGRVGGGANEIIKELELTEVPPSEFLLRSFDTPVVSHLNVEHYYWRKDGSPFDENEFYAHPEIFESNLESYIERDTDMYIPCHYWSDRGPKLLTAEFLKTGKHRLKVVADVSCDIADPIASTLRPSTIEDPIYGYDPHTGKEVDFREEDAIAVMAVDNLPCELPRDASEDFGNQLIANVFPELFGKENSVMIEKASETNLSGELMPDFEYLHAYVHDVN